MHSTTKYVSKTISETNKPSSLPFAALSEMRPPGFLLRRSILGRPIHQNLVAIGWHVARDMQAAKMASENCSDSTLKLAQKNCRESRRQVLEHVPWLVSQLTSTAHTFNYTRHADSGAHESHSYRRRSYFRSTHVDASVCASLRLCGVESWINAIARWWWWCHQRGVLLSSGDRSEIIMQMRLYQDWSFLGTERELALVECRCVPPSCLRSAFRGTCHFTPPRPAPPVPSAV